MELTPPLLMRCSRESVYAGSLTYGQSYAVLAWDTEKRQLQLLDDRRRKRWYPVTCFVSAEETLPRIALLRHEPIVDPQHDVVEVEIELSTGEWRWCFFTTPAYLTTCGDLLAGTEVRFHYGAPHRLIVTELNERIIQRVIEFLLIQGELMACTLPLLNKSDIVTGEG